MFNIALLSNLGYTFFSKQVPFVISVKLLIVDFLQTEQLKCDVIYFVQLAEPL